MDLDELTKIADLMVKLRDKRAELNAAHNAKLAHMDALAAQLEARALALNHTDSGVSSVKTDHGTLLFGIKTRTNVIDWPAFYRFIATHDRFDFLHKRVADKAVAEFTADSPEGVPPPGITLFNQRTVMVRRPGEA